MKSFSEAEYAEFEITYGFYDGDAFFASKNTVEILNRH